MTAETASIRLSYIINHDVTKAAMQNFSARTGISLAADATDGYQILWPVCGIPILAVIPLVYHLMRIEPTGKPEPSLG